MLLIGWKCDRHVNKHIYKEIFIIIHKHLESYHVIYQTEAKSIFILIMKKRISFEHRQFLGLPLYINNMEKKCNID